MSGFFCGLSFMALVWGTWYITKGDSNQFTLMLLGLMCLLGCSIWAGVDSKKW